jgi:uncharacterized protein (DUF302 family)
MKIFRTLFLPLLLIGLSNGAAAAGKPPQPTQSIDISQTVVKVKLAEGVSADDAIDALQSRAITLNMKQVAHQPLSQELKARGIDAERLEIFQFCNPEDAYKMVQFNPIFAAYMPCRIALVEEPDGTTSLMMINLNMLINNTELPPELKEIATTINNNLMEIMQAGASGAF